MYKQIGYLLALILLLSACQSTSQQTAEKKEETTAPQPEGRFDAAIAAFEAADQQNPPPENAWLFTGSSSIRMWKTVAEDMAPMPVINRGFGGSTMPDLIHYADRVIYPYKPKGILVYEGDNDITSEDMSPEDVLANLKSLHSMVQEKLPATPMWFISVKPSVARKHLLDKLKKTNALVEAYAAETPTMSYIDVATPMMQDENKVRDDIFIKDNLHMNAKGYEIWKGVIRPVLEGYSP